MKALGWVLVVGLVLMVLGRVSRPESGVVGTAARPAAQQQTAQLVSISCAANHGRPRADLVLRNTSSQEIRYGKVFVRFGDELQDNYLRETTMPPGSLSSAVLYANHGASQDCRLEAVQDADGNAVRVTR